MAAPSHFILKTTLWGRSGLTFPIIFILAGQGSLPHECKTTTIPCMGSTMMGTKPTIVGARERRSPAKWGGGAEKHRLRCTLKGALVRFRVWLASGHSVTPASSRSTWDELPGVLRHPHQGVFEPRQYWILTQTGPSISPRAIQRGSLREHTRIKMDATVTADRQSGILAWGGSNETGWVRKGKAWNVLLSTSACQGSGDVPDNY